MISLGSMGSNPSQTDGVVGISRIQHVKDLRTDIELLLVDNHGNEQITWCLAHNLEANMFVRK